MATETLLMRATLAGGDRQHLHEVIRRHSMTAHQAVSRGDDNPLIALLREDREFTLDESQIGAALDPYQYVGRAPEQVVEYLTEVVEPAIAEIPIAEVEEPRV